MSFPEMFKKPKLILNQGDIFLRFGGKEIPKGEDKELAFIVLTYSCDLEHPKDLNYILISPIFSFNTLIGKFLEKNKNKSIEKLKDALKSRIIEFFNNDTRFHFFLSPIPDICNNPAYADLGQIITLHKKFTNEIIENRKMSLEKPWREKLGWMTGNLFNRIALEDIKNTVTEQFIEKNEVIKIFFENKINGIITSLEKYLDSESQNVQVIKKYFLPLCLKNQEITRDILKQHLSKFFDANDIEKEMERISTELLNSDNDFLREIINFEKKYHKLENFKINEIFKQIIKNHFEFQ